MLFETLQRRELMAADFDVSMVDGVLRIVGTELDDQVDVRQINDRITIDGVEGDWRRPESLLVFGIGGNDVIRNHTDIPSKLNGGSGKDVIDGGVGDDEIWGGTGDGEFSVKARKPVFKFLVLFG